MKSRLKNPTDKFRFGHENKRYGRSRLAAAGGKDMLINPSELFGPVSAEEGIKL
jgi:hypothetical protein